MAEQIKSALTILRRKQVEARTGLPRSTIYRYITEGTFPAPISLGRHSVGWVETSVTDWIEGRIAANREDIAA